MSFLSKAEEVKIQERIHARSEREAAAAEAAAAALAATVKSAPSQPSSAMPVAHAARDGTTLESLEASERNMILDARKKVSGCVQGGCCFFFAERIVAPKRTMRLVLFTILQCRAIAAGRAAAAAAGVQCSSTYTLPPRLHSTRDEKGGRSSRRRVKRGRVCGKVGQARAHDRETAVAHLRICRHHQPRGKAVQPRRHPLRARDRGALTWSSGRSPKVCSVKRRECEERWGRMEENSVVLRVGAGSIRSESLQT